jgi:hypothetical protein
MFRKRFLTCLGALLASAGLTHAESASTPTSTSTDQNPPAKTDDSLPPASVPAPAAQACAGPSTLLCACDSDEPSREGYFYAGAAATFFRPRFEGTSGGSLSPLRLLSNPNPFFANLVVPLTPTGGGNLEYDRETDGRFWLGFETEYGLGLRGRTSLYRSNSNSIGAAASGSGNAIAGLFTTTASEVDNLVAKLDMDVTDIDATYEFRGCGWSVLGGVGARYANLRRRADLASTFSQTDNVAGILTVVSNQSLSQELDEAFRAWGPTVALEARRCVAWGQLRAAAFVNTRVSWLSGNTSFDTSTQSSASTQQFVVGIGPITPLTTTNTASQLSSELRNSTTVLELELGLEAGWRTKIGEFFVRGSWEGQEWRHGGSVIGTGGVNDNLYLTGWTIGAGWRY